MKADAGYAEEKKYYDGCSFSESVRYVAATYNVGDWILVSGREAMVGIGSIVGKIVSKTERLFVVRSEIGGYCVAYSWIDTMIYPNSFKKISLHEAMDTVRERSRMRFFRE